MNVLEGVVQLDRRDDPPRVVLDTNPVQVLDVRWTDIEGCYLLRIALDGVAHHLGVTCTSLVVEVLFVRHRGPFLRIPGEDSFWPTVEKYGLGLSSLSAVAQRDARAARPQLQLAMGRASHERGSHGAMTPRKKGRP